MIKYICVNNYQLFIMISKNYVKKDKTRYVSSTKGSCGVCKRRRKKDEKVFISFTVGGNGRLSAGWMRIC
ncbi:hypothetical protein, partial [Hungatella sp.]|uniref:hypothetical protein n=1 Tax=Hungatella sp. TaxID=2613924 RepID=UPI002A80BA4D